MTTGEKIRNRRLELHMTMEDLGRAIGVQRSAINKYEKGMVDIKSSTLSAIASALGVSAISLLDDIDDFPHTEEARTLARGIDKLPQEQREQALNVIKAMFSQYADYFEKETNDDT